MSTALSLEKSFLASPVASLRFHNDELLLVGNGPHLELYHVPTCTVIDSVLALESSRIHRIVFGTRVIKGNKESRIIVVYGGKSIRFLQLEVEEGAQTQVPKHQFILGELLSDLTDWILDVTLLYPNEESVEPTELAIAYAHNFIEIWDIETFTRVYHNQCEVRCILYSARFFGTQREDLILASGTVFNEVHLWSATKKNISGDGYVYKKFIGHEGVIFGIRFSEDGKLLTSVSDDRTIRVWKTGEENTKAKVIYGHFARIWDCQILDHYLISVSEDSTCRVWSFDNANVEEEINCLACWDGHTGKNVWSVAVNPSQKIAATGGGDTGIRLWSLDSVEKSKIESLSQMHELALPSTATYLTEDQLLQNAESRNKEHIRNFVAVDYSTVVLSTHIGHVLKYEHKANLWSPLYFDQDLFSYSMMCASECGRVVACGTLSGHLILLSPTSAFKPFKAQVHHEKVFEIFVKPSTDPNVFNVISHGVGNEIFWQRFDIRDSQNPTFLSVAQLDLPSKVLLLSVAVDEEIGLVVCGTRESHLLVYHHEVSNHATEAADKPPIICPSIVIRKAHDKQSVTAIAIQKARDNKGATKVTLYSTGRDGAFAQYRIEGFNSHMEESNSDEAEGSDDEADNDDEAAKLPASNVLDITYSPSCKITMDRTYRAKITKGWLEGLTFASGDLLLLGFYRKRFFVYNEAKRYEVLSVACGGAHRRWHFRTKDVGMSLATFNFIRRDRILSYYMETEEKDAQGPFVDPKLKESYHGRDVRAIKYLNYADRSSINDPIVFVTGGEDCLLKIFQYLPNSNIDRIRNLKTIKKHTSVIKSICESKGIEHCLFTGGGGEQLKCWKIEVEKTGVFEAETELASVGCLEWAVCPKVSDIAETRIMDMTAFTLEPTSGLHFIGVVYSDAVIRLWVYNENLREFVLLADGGFHNHCILQVTHCVHEGKALLFSGATDGRIAIWNITDVVQRYTSTLASKEIQKLTPICNFMAHMSGVNCLDVLQQENLILVATGGDDNALAVTALTLESDSISIANVHKILLPPAHASALQATAIYSNTYVVTVTLAVKLVDTNTVITTSTDQRLNVWKIRDDLTLHQSLFVDVADPSAMDLLYLTPEKIQLSITGIGIQTFQSAVYQNDGL
ncbi:WD40 repeat-like protein [Basidiobolus meristosporus CBS 931.73]|uniref:WD40 repeat-like protein n=1 Tax=Basidiobolus meristosporus CBS 931.73 TaxID=1314790 RepID=A0A1Y1YM40_9FUNG|nr:WD40 repeat-like protein [Basidiobolus meristosporus CBS 931.73]|eukprot:ORX99065.1 WD40 repeat-like protein [Basidiobolus meristosporus CBS 931.73]